jgi:hypothetical protein
MEIMTFDSYLQTNIITWTETQTVSKNSNGANKRSIWQQSKQIFQQQRPRELKTILLIYSIWRNTCIVCLNFTALKRPRWRNYVGSQIALETGVNILIHGGKKYDAKRRGRTRKNRRKRKKIESRRKKEPSVPKPEMIVRYIIKIFLFISIDLIITNNTKDHIEKNLKPAIIRKCHQ